MNCPRDSRDPTEHQINLGAEFYAAVEKMPAIGRRVLAFSLALAAAIGLSWITESCSAFVRGRPEPGEAKLLVLGLILLLVGSSLLYLLRRRLFGTRVIKFVEASDRHARPCLIVVLSRQRRPPPRRTPNAEVSASPPTLGSPGLPFPDWKSRLSRTESGAYKVSGIPTTAKSPHDPALAGQVVADGVVLTGRLDADIALLDAFDITQQWPWQQVLRAIKPHLTKIKRIWILGSPDGKESPGSADEMEDCIQWLASYPEIRAAVLGDRKRHVVDFENYEELEAKFRQVIQEEKALSASNDDRRIVIEITGGQKTTSIAAAAVTLNSDIVFQYVQTNEPKLPYIYDITYDNPLFHEPEDS